jgi:dihydroorotase
MDIYVHQERFWISVRSQKRTQVGFRLVIPAEGLIITPGLIDMHTHLREPGFEYKETILTGVQAAVAGGFTAVACMANTLPVNDTQSVTDYILKKAKEARLARVFPIGAVSLGLRRPCGMAGN